MSGNVSIVSPEHTPNQNIASDCMCHVLIYSTLLSTIMWTWLNSNRTCTLHFQMSDAVVSVTLKLGKGHWKKNKQVKLPCKFDIFDLSHPRVTCNPTTQCENNTNRYTDSRTLMKVKNARNYYFFSANKNWCWQQQKDNIYKTIHKTVCFFNCW